MTKKPPTNDDYHALFVKAVPGVKKLKEKHEKIKLKSKQNIRSNIREEGPDNICFSEDSDEKPVTSNTLLSYRHQSVPHKTLRHLAKGQYRIDAILDLHGMTVEKARHSLLHFLSQCLQKNLRVALIIHGRKISNNQPILKNKLNIWLRSTKAVLAFCSADASHGNQGALLVLLKRQREESLSE